MKIVCLGQALIREPVIWPDHIREVVSGADAVFCNFEGCVAPAGAWPMKNKTVHPAHPDAFRYLRQLGVTHLSLANNHVWDFGHAGIIETLNAAQAWGFAVSGAGYDAQTASQAGIAHGAAMIALDLGPTPPWAVACKGPGINALGLKRYLAVPQTDLERLQAIAETTGYARHSSQRVKIGYDREKSVTDFFGLNIVEAGEPEEQWLADPADLERLAATIASVKPEVDAVLVSLHYHHWAADWTMPPSWIDSLGKVLSDMGADAIVGHGPPFSYGMRQAGKAHLAPSLGNLVFHTERGPRYDAQGPAVWVGGALTIEDGSARYHQLDVVRPSAA